MTTQTDPPDELCWRIAGGSGDGIDSTSQNFAKALMRSGLSVFTHRHFPSRIRGGHTYVEVRAAPHELQARGDGYNVLLALGDSFARNPDEDAYYGNERVAPLAENLEALHPGGIIVYDSSVIEPEDVEAIDLEERAADNDWHVYPVDLHGIATEHGQAVMRNTAGVGVTAALVGIDLEPIETLMGEAMSGAVLEANEAILAAAHEHALELEHTHDLTVPTGSHDEAVALLSGSAAIAYGAIDAGCRFVAGYPMTPWTDVFTILSQEFPSIGGVAEQVEDEIAAASLAVGASHAGAKALSGSSGGGFALMSEPLGLAEMTETPVVLLEAMRAGPSTGMPTKPGQGDLEHVLYTSQGDSNRVVLAPGTVEEAYEQTRQAFELAWEYQLPAIVVYDQKLAGELTTVPTAFFDREPDPGLGSTLTEAELAEAAHEASGKFRRYRHDADRGISPRSLPGQAGGRFLASGNEHTEVGHISEDPDNRVAQVDRRQRKLASIRSDLDGTAASTQTYLGPETADYGIITWGSSQGAVAEGLERLLEAGESVRAVGVSTLAPFPKDEIGAFLESVEAALVVEMNASGQFRGLCQRELGAYGDTLVSLLKYDGTPFEPGDIVAGYEHAFGDRTGDPERRIRLQHDRGDPQ